jgi:hypothetical protein
MKHFFIKKLCQILSFFARKLASFALKAHFFEIFLKSIYFPVVLSDDEQSVQNAKMGNSMLKSFDLHEKQHEIEKVTPQHDSEESYNSEIMIKYALSNERQKKMFSEYELELLFGASKNKLN